MRVFISYSHTDSKTADEICDVLTRREIQFFRDSKEIAWGENITTKVRRALDAVGSVIVIISPGSAKSQWVSFEIGYSVASKKQVLPFLTHPSMDLPPFFGDLAYASSLDDVERFFDVQDPEGGNGVIDLWDSPSLDDLELTYNQKMRLLERFYCGHTDFEVEIARALGAADIERNADIRAKANEPQKRDAT